MWVVLGAYVERTSFVLSQNSRSPRPSTTPPPAHAPGQAPSPRALQLI